MTSNIIRFATPAIPQINSHI